MNKPLFLAAYPYQENVLALPVKSIDEAVRWYSKAFGMTETQRTDKPHSSVVLERDGVSIGFAVNGGDASQDGAAILVSDIIEAKASLESNGLAIEAMREDERDGNRFKVFFVVAPDGLCFYFHQLIQNNA